MGVWGFGVFGPLPPKSPKAPNTQTPFFGSMLRELSIDNLRSSSEIFSALFHLPARYSGDRRESFLHLSIFPGRHSEFAGNLPSVFSSTLADIRGSLEIFPALFHLPLPTSKIRRESFLHFSIYPSRFQGFVGNLFINFPYTFPDILR